MEIVKFQPSDTQSVSDFFCSVFNDSEGETEGFIISRLVSDLVTSTKADDFIGFVAKLETIITGGVFFSRLTLTCGYTAFLLSPLAVIPKYQGQGIGQKLIREGLNALKVHPVDFVFTYGDPKYYARTDFLPLDEKIIKAPYRLKQPEGWLGQSLGKVSISELRGQAQCVPAFQNPCYW